MSSPPDRVGVAEVGVAHGGSSRISAGVPLAITTPKSITTIRSQVDITRPDVVLDEQHAHVALVGEPPDEARQLRALVLVEAGGRLVEQHDRRARTPPSCAMPTSRRRPYGSSSGVSSRCGSSSNSRTAATAVDGRSWRPGQNRSVTHDSRDVPTSLPARMFSSTLTSSNSSSDWNERRSPSRARWVAFRPSMRRPSSEIDPSPTATKPVTASMSVVLPAPFGPIRPTTSPGRTSSDTSCTATTEPKRTVRLVDRERGGAARARPRRAAAAGARPAGDEVEPLPEPAAVGGGDVGDAVLVDDEDQEEDERAEDEVPLAPEADPVLHDAGAEAADRVGRTEDRAEHEPEATDHGVTEAVDRREDVELAVGDRPGPGRPTRMPATAASPADTANAYSFTPNTEMPSEAAARSLVRTASSGRPVRDRRRLATSSARSTKHTEAHRRPGVRVVEGVDLERRTASPGRCACRRRARRRGSAGWRTPPPTPGSPGRG